jgi:hypothetical protein
VKKSKVLALMATELHPHTKLSLRDQVRRPRMKQRMLKLITLALCAGIVPTVLAQNSKNAKPDIAPPGTELIAWTQAQEPRPVLSSQSYQQAEPRPGAQQPSQQPASGQHDDMQKQNATQTFAGTIMKSGNQYVLRTADNVTYQLDDQARAKKYEGKQVQIVGSLDETSGTIRVEEMKEAG